MSSMQPIHTIEYELTSAWAAEIERTLARWEWRRGGWRDAPQFVAALVLAVLIVWLVVQGWVVPGVGGGLMALLTLLVIGTIFRRWSMARSTVATALLALHTSERRVRIDFGADRIRLEAEFFRGEGAWKELDEVMAFKDFWVLYLSNGGRILIPGTQVSPEVAAFIQAKAEEVGAPIWNQG